MDERATGATGHSRPVFLGQQAVVIVECPKHRRPLTPGVDVLDWIDHLQWPAMVVTVAAAWLVASKSERRREIGFWVFLASNALWVVWGWSTQAYALVSLQIALAAMNIRGAYKTSSASKP